QGEFDRARKYLPKLNGEYQGESFQLEIQILTAFLEVMQGNIEQAKAALPDLSAISSGDYHRWFEVYYHINKAEPDREDSRTDYLFSRAIGELSQNGAVRYAFNLGLLAIDLALVRNRYFTAELHSLDVEELIPRLYQDLGASEQLESARRAIRAARQSRPQTRQFDSVDELLNEIDKEDNSSESRLILLDQHLGKWPDDEQLICKLSDILYELGKYEQSGKRLIKLLQKH
ncbi:MAG: hypothetical protein GWO08_20030, partial [Gammaproteobacteria bacterium]|nr:hypothetical protein [Gammaproteobacteria bacterium]NIR95834.1 hypothetical protein [Gammaproteobacteria bacterium]NIW47501.1 hypothetical protein [Gammaproteobacteria bacterium]